ncbi:acyl-CoA dehydrogenase family protein [Streptomyces mirabilis]|uniref:acyl-CoA dehydrogenase family protein n=1 Tax=Streptomyces mirabilis TaxID=68239 RepID=UPI0037178EE5
MAAAPETEVRDELRAVARELLAKRRASEEVPRRRLAEAGWLGLEVPEELDGAGVTFAETAVVLEELGRAAARTGYFGTTVLAAGTLTALQPTAERDALLRRTANGTQALTAALVDATDDSLVAGTFDDRDVPFRIEDSPAGPRLSGHAGFVPDAAEADRLLILALDPAGTPVVVLLAPGAEGLTVTGQPVLDATRRFARVRAEAVAPDAGCVLRFDGEPRRAVGRLLDRAAVATACDSLGLAEAMLQATVAHTRGREQFGRPVGSFQAVKHACADMLVRLSVSRHLVSEAVRLIAEDHVEAGVAASMAKSYVCAAAVDVVGKAMQLHGGMGYTWESGIHVHLKRATLNRSLFGSPAAHRRRLARRYR